MIGISKISSDAHTRYTIDILELVPAFLSPFVLVLGFV